MRARNRLLASLGAVFLFAIASISSGLDRAGEYRPGLAEWVPALFRVDSARVLARKALAENRPVLAAGEARLSVVRDPIDARSLGLYGAGLQLSGKEAGARAAFAVSGSLGWREPLTQLYWMSVAFNEGNLRVAALRLDAILRQAPAYPGRDQLLAGFEAYPEGRAQLAKRLVDKPAWRDVYFGESFAISPSARILRADVARHLAEDEGRRDCPLIGPLLYQLAEAGEYATAHGVWRQHCRQADDGEFLADGGFSRANAVQPASAFDWAWSDDGALGISIAAVEGFAGMALTVESNSPRETGFATQMLVLPPGAYAATWRARDNAGQVSGDIRLSLSCDKSRPEDRVSTLRNARTGEWEALFTVPAGCPAQWLSLRIAPGIRIVTVDDVGVVRR
ncbi:MAG: hypothetical protein AB7F98_00425 [Novosphingobium sp.]